MKFRSTILLLAAVVSGVVSAARLSVDDARSAARAFASERRHLGAWIGPFPRTAREHSAADGSRFFSVRMSGGGTVFLSGDDEQEPVIAFSSSDIDYDRLDRDSPLYALLSRDARVRSGARGAKDRWRRLLASGDSSPAYPSLLTIPQSLSSVTEPGDVRVPALVATKWDQGYVGGRPCFNYYTPGNSACGCVATSMSQLMRYHRWPDSGHPVSAEKKTCTYGGVMEEYTMQGGSYDWDLMPLNTSGDPVATEAQRQAIGKLASDAGISVMMYYTKYVSSTYDMFAVDALMNVWNYGQATFLNDYYVNGYGYVNGQFGEEKRLMVLRKALFSNFDAGCPVMLGIGIRATGEGHSILADGYGFEDGTDYVHLNLGWSGDGDVWYNLPTISTRYSFDSIDDVIYNVFPTNGTTSAAFSGRIVDLDGKGVPGASVRIVRRSDSRTMATLRTSASGVYGAILPAGTYNVVAVSPDLSATGRVSSVSLFAPLTSRINYELDHYPNTYVSERNVTPNSRIGNSWGNDITLGFHFRTEPEDFYVSAASGVDAPGRGGREAPFATICYAVTNGQQFVSGDVINVLPGTYLGCVETPAESVMIISTDGPGVTVIDGEGLDCCYCGERNPSNLLAGFTLRNGAARGGMFYGTATNCVITGCTNDSLGTGGGAYCADLYGCVLYGNSASYGGGAYYGTQVDCVFSNCTASFGGAAAGAVLTNCLVIGNSASRYLSGTRYSGGYGGGVYECDIANCTVAGNSADSYGGGAFLQNRGESRNSIVCGNTCAAGPSCGNDVYGNHYWTMSNTVVDVDARFRDPANGDYRILPSSPAFDAGDLTHVAVDHDLAGTNRVWGASVDCGCYEYHLPSAAMTDPGIVVGDSSETAAEKVSEAVRREGYGEEYAAAVPTLKDYAYLVEWAADHSLSGAEIGASPTGFISPALGADGLLAWNPTNVVFRSFTPVAGDTNAQFTVTFPWYDQQRINLPLLCASLGVVSAESLADGFVPYGLDTMMVATPTNVLFSVTAPAAPSRFYKITVR